MSQVALKFEGAQLPTISNLNTAVHMTSKGITVEPTSFTVGAAQASVEASANSIKPLNAAFSVKADSLQLSQMVPSRPPGEFVNQLAISGTAGGDLSAPVVKTQIKSATRLRGSPRFQQSGSFRNLCEQPDFRAALVGGGVRRIGTRQHQYRAGQPAPFQRLGQLQPHQHARCDGMAGRSHPCPHRLYDRQRQPLGKRNQMA